MKNYILILAVFLSGCSNPNNPLEDWEPTTITKCSDSVTESIARFTLKCIENANPKSDEEPEDWINVCKDMAESTYCKKVPAVTRWTGSARLTVNCDNVTTDYQKNICNQIK